jgi:hypothetical protein
MGHASRWARRVAFFTGEWGRMKVLEGFGKSTTKARRTQRRTKKQEEGSQIAGSVGFVA